MSDYFRVSVFNCTFYALSNLLYHFINPLYVNSVLANLSMCLAVN